LTPCSGSPKTAFEQSMPFAKVLGVVYVPFAP
jgi:hypothetical protein